MLVGNANSFLHELAHTVDTILIEGLELNSGCLIDGLEIKHVAFFMFVLLVTLVNEKETLSLLNH